MATRVVRDRGQSFDQFRLGRSQGRRGVGHKDEVALDYVRSRRSNERLDIVGIGGKRAIEKAARSSDTVRGHTLVEPSQALEKEVNRVGGRGLFGASRLGGDEFGV